MELTEREKDTKQKAINFVETHKDELIEQFITSKKPLLVDIFSFFMARSPGAGKTEFSQRYLADIIGKIKSGLVKYLADYGMDVGSFRTLFIRIDADEVREFLPQYQKTQECKKITGNAHIVQGAVNKGLDILRVYCFKNKISFLHDSTFGNYKTMRTLVEKSLTLDRDVQIFYLYLDPLMAWRFTKAREYLEGRNVLKETFVKQFFASQTSVDKIKREFGKRVQLNCILKDNRNKIVNVEFDVASVDSFLEEQYNKNLIRKYSPDNLRHLIV
jgi:hypothetical protein